MKLGARVQAFDPTVNVVRTGIPNDLVIAASSDEATSRADVLGDDGVEQFNIVGTREQR